MLKSPSRSRIVTALAVPALGVARAAIDDWDRCVNVFTKDKQNDRAARRYFFDLAAC
jgi:hypothetical protein